MDLSYLLMAQTSQATTPHTSNGEKKAAQGTFGMTAKSAEGNSGENATQGLPYPFNISDFNKFLLSKTLGSDDLATEIAAETTPVTINTQIEDALALLSSALQQYITENGHPDGDITDDLPEDGETVIDLTAFLPENTGKINITKSEDGTVTLELSKEAQTLLKSFLKGLPENVVTSTIEIPVDSSSVFANTEATLNKQDLFEKILSNITQQQTKDKIAPEAFIASGLTPEDFTLMLEEGLLTGTEVILTEPTTDNSELSEDLLVLLDLVPEEAALPPQIKAALSSLATASNKDVLPKNISGIPPEATGLPTTDDASLLSEDGTELVSKSEKALKEATAQTLLPTSNQNIQTNGQNVPSAAAFAAFMNSFDTKEALGLNPSSLEWAPGSTFPSAMSGTNLTAHVTQTPQASVPHPATHMVAAHIQKNAAAGAEGRQTWTLQLDPPELGRIEVKMNFNKAEAVKAHIVVEKPETFFMLQRDAQILERSLQDIGLDTDQGLSFELAQDSHEFGHDGSHDGHQGGGSGNGTAEGDEIEIIETTMNWYVDPNTGMQRYDLVV